MTAAGLYPDSNGRWRLKLRGTPLWSSDIDARSARKVREKVAIPPVTARADAPHIGWARIPPTTVNRSNPIYKVNTYLIWNALFVDSSELKRARR
jgi:hypothetical protein